ncbi:hypothetical protein F9Z84_07005 [Escherichia coli]|nr:hypothetical protein F9Z84_07005 [Escherichia coli]
MSACLGDIEHYATMVAGCENMNLAMAGKGELNADGKYAYSVLKLHINDMGSVAGQEGFLDTMKKTAANVKEWISKLVAAVKNFITGKRSSKQKLDADFKKIETEVKKVITEKKKDDQKSEGKEEKSENVVNFMNKPAIAVHGALTELQTKVKTLGEELTGEGFDAIGYKPNFGRLIECVDKAVKFSTEENAHALEVGLNLTRTLDELSKECNNLNDKLSAYANNSNIDDAEKNRIGGLVSNKLSTFGGIMGGAEKIAMSLKQKQVAALDAFMKA